MLGGWEFEVESSDPTVTFEAVRPLFVPNASGDAYEIPPSRQWYFSPESFPVRKSGKAFRIFVLGGSTVQGEPYTSRTSFTTWLELQLRATDPSRDWDVVNCGGISYASYRLAPILEECLAYQPDLFILCIGHNEFLEDRTRAEVREIPGAVRQTHVTMSEWRSYRMLQWCLGRSTPRSSADTVVMPTEVTARLDFRRGMEKFQRDPEGRQAIVEHYGQNLRGMLTKARAASVPVILMQPSSNLADCPPFKSEHAPLLSPASRQAWEQHVRQAHECYSTSLPQAVEHLEAATTLDPEFAQTWYELGQCYDRQGDYPRARAAFVEARDRDICPLRMLTPLEAELRAAATDFDVPLINAHDLLERQSPSGILGSFLLVDHVHPSICGHQLLANALADEFATQGILHRSAAWRSTRDSAYATHLNGLEPMYFLKAERTRQRLEGWAQGRAELPSRRSALLVRPEGPAKRRVNRMVRN